MPEAKGQWPHGATQLPGITIDSYSLALRQRKDEPFVGDAASRRAFHAILEAWRRLFAEMNGKDPLGKRDTPAIAKKKLDVLLADKGPAAATIQAALHDYADQLAYVIERFLHQPSWKGVQRVVMGGGMKQSELGARAIKLAGKRLFERDVHVQLRLLHEHADEGGLLGWAHVLPPEILHRYRAMLAVDIGGTNVRCGVVRWRPREDKPPKAKVVLSQKWNHAADKNGRRRGYLLRGIARMLEELVEAAKEEKLKLAPFVGVACPGRIRKNGSIGNGAQNLPGDWAREEFHLPTALGKLLPQIDGKDPLVTLHNDAVIQGLSELPWIEEDIERWGVLTIGTGLGNVCYTMVR
jgi:hypothetical protein